MKYRQRVTEANRRLPIYAEAVQSLTKMLRLFETSDIHPVVTRKNEDYTIGFRNNGPIEALLLKYALLVSLNETLILLLQVGKIFEQGIIQRSIEETNEDIAFIAMNVTGTAASSKFDAFLTEFWREDYTDPNDPAGSRVKSAYTRRGIQPFLNRSVKQPDPSTADAHAKAIYQMYSGFTHGAARQILELYNEHDRKFETRGMLGTNRHVDYVLDATHSIYRSLLSMGMIGKAFGIQEVVDRAISHRNEFEKAIGPSKVYRQTSE